MADDIPTSNRTGHEMDAPASGALDADDRLERLRDEKQQISWKIGELKSGGTDVSDLIARASELKEEIQCIENAQKAARETDRSDCGEVDAEAVPRPHSMCASSAATSTRSLKAAIIDSDDWSEWDERLLACRGSVFHSSKWAQFRMMCGDEMCVRIGLMDGEKLVRPLALATLQSGRLSRCLRVRGAIETQVPEELAEGVGLLLETAKEERCVTVRVDGRDFIAEQQGLEQFGFSGTGTIEVVVPCDRSEDALWTAVDRKSRESVRRARRRGIAVEEQSDAAGVDLAAQLDMTLREAKREDGSRYARVGGDEYHAIWDVFGPSGDVKFFIARLDGEPVGSFMLLTWGTRTYAWRAGYTLEARRLGASAPLYWGALTFTCRSCFHSLNLGPLPRGADDRQSEHHGLYRFKIRWDGRAIPRESGSIVLRPVLHRVTKAVHALRSR